MKKNLLTRLMIITLSISMLAIWGCAFPFTNSSKVDELESKIDELEQKLEESEQEEKETGVTEETAEESIQESGETDETEDDTIITRNKIAIIDQSIDDFNKFQAMLFEKNLSLIKEFESSSFQSVALAISLHPDDARLTKLNDYVKGGGRAICFYDDATVRRNDILNQLYGVSVADETLLKKNTNAITLDGELFADFAKGLKIAYIKENVSYISIQAYINDISGDSFWHSEYTSQETGKNLYFSLMKKIGDGEILFTPMIKSIIPLDDKHIMDMDNSELALRIIRWSLGS